MLLQNFYHTDTSVVSILSSYSRQKKREYAYFPKCLSIPLSDDEQFVLHFLAMIEELASLFSITVLMSADSKLKQLTDVGTDVDDIQMLSPH